MTNVTADSAKKTAENSAENCSLDRRYRQIGISAVAAAVRYQSDGKNPAYAPAPVRWDDHTDEAA